MNIYEKILVEDYEKHFLPIEIYTASIDLVGRLVSNVIQQLKADSFSFESNQHSPVRRQITKALIYVSLRYQNEGSIRDDYIGQMNAEIIDARKLGM